MKGIDRAVAIFGTKAALARASRLLPQEINRYCKRGWVTAKHCQALVIAVQQELPEALGRGVTPDIARLISLHEFNPVFPADSHIGNTEALAGA